MTRLTVLALLFLYMVPAQGQTYLTDVYKPVESDGYENFPT